MPAEKAQIRTKRTKTALQLVGNQAAAWPCAAGSGREHERVTCVRRRLPPYARVAQGTHIGETAEVGLDCERLIMRIHGLDVLGAFRSQVVVPLAHV